MFFCDSGLGKSYHVPKHLWQRNILQGFAGQKERCNVFRAVPRNAASDGGDEKLLLRMGFCNGAELPDLLFKHRPAAHGIDGIALPLQSMPLPHDGTEFLHGDFGRSRAMEPVRIRTEDEDFIRSELCDEGGRDSAFRVAGGRRSCPFPFF